AYRAIGRGTISLHDALPIYRCVRGFGLVTAAQVQCHRFYAARGCWQCCVGLEQCLCLCWAPEAVGPPNRRTPQHIPANGHRLARSEEQTSELQSRENIVCCL